MEQAGTARPWTGWGGTERRERYQRRRVRLSLQDLADLRDLRNLKIDWRLARPDIALYTPNQIRHLIRLEGGAAAGRAAPVVFPTVWIHGLPRDLQPNGGGGPWRLPDPNLRWSPIVPLPTSTQPPLSAAWWGGALPAAAALLALLALLARAAEKCLDNRFFKLTRRRSEEWPTPNVLATNLRHRRDLELPPPLDDVFPTEPLRPPQLSDPPPPYSECATTAVQREANEEPPPPYSTCYVSFSNPRDGLPSVHFFNSRRQRMFGSGSTQSSVSNSTDTGQPNTSTNSSTEETTGRQLVFDNGRVIERETSDDRVPSTSEDVDSVGMNGNGNIAANGNDYVVQVSEDLPETIIVA